MAAVGFLCTVVVFETLRHVAGISTQAELAASPAAISQGKLWLLVTSALLVNGPSLLELPGLFVAVALLIRRHGAVSFWRVAPVAHVGSTLIAYAGIGLLWLTDRASANGPAHRLDYGISGIWLGVLGALFAGSWLAFCRHESTSLGWLILGVCLGAAAGGFFFFSLLLGTEHLLAFALGAVVFVASDSTSRGRRRAARGRLSRRA